MDKWSQDRPDPSDNWLPMTQRPKKNGWYDCWRHHVTKNGTTEELFLGLYRDGKWIETPKDVIYWKEPMIRSDWKKPYIKNNDTAMRLALALAADYSNDYEAAYRHMLTERIGTERWIFAQANFDRARRWMLSPEYEVITMGAVPSEKVMSELRKRVIRSTWRGYDGNRNL